MPAILIALAGMLTQLCASMVGRVLLAIGVSFVTYKGLDVAFSHLRELVMGQMSGLGARVIVMASAAGVWDAIDMIFAAITARLTISGIRNGSFTRMLYK